ncbi:ankyrin repeat-containing domain protein [Kalaharituber pfeilii]|nr:ankyrin repeat-containing domain protein [Kalaharituber pfeilii]
MPDAGDITFGSVGGGVPRKPAHPGRQALLDVVTVHPQLGYVETKVRFDIQRLIKDRSIRLPQLRDNFKDLTIWEGQAPGPEIRPGNNGNNAEDAMLLHVMALLYSGQYIRMHNISEPLVSSTHYRDALVLLLAMMESHMDLVKALLEHPPKTNEANKAGHRLLSAVHVTAQCFLQPNSRRATIEEQYYDPTYSHVLDWILRHTDTGNDINMEYHMGNNTSVVKILLAHGASMRSCNDCIKPLLHIAAVLGRVSAVEILLAHGASVTDCDNEGHTPLQLATRSPTPFKDDVIRILQAHEASMVDRYHGGRATSHMDASD